MKALLFGKKWAKAIVTIKKLLSNSLIDNKTSK